MTNCRDGSGARQHLLGFPIRHSSFCHSASIPRRPDSGTGRKRQDSGAAMAGGFSWPRRSDGLTFAAGFGSPGGAGGLSLPTEPKYPSVGWSPLFRRNRREILRASQVLVLGPFFCRAVEANGAPAPSHLRPPPPLPDAAAHWPRGGLPLGGFAPKPPGFTALRARAAPSSRHLRPLRPQGLPSPPRR